MRSAFVWALVVGVLLLISMCAPSLAHPKNKKYPPQYGVYVRVAQCEQPAPASYKKENGKWPANMRWGVWWEQTHNYSFPGGGGMQTYLWTEFRRRSAQRFPTMDKAPIHEQLWAMHRLWVWAEATYPGAGHTAWVCARKSWFPR